MFSLERLEVSFRRPVEGLPSAALDFPPTVVDTKESNEAILMTKHFINY